MNNIPEALAKGRLTADFQTAPLVLFGTSTPHSCRPPTMMCPTMMLLYLIVVAIFAATKWEAPLTQGEEEVCGFGFGKKGIS
jgi:hypothetical protein